MKKQLYIYAILVLGFIAYNVFFRLEDDRLDTIVFILYASVLFLYISYIAVSILAKIKKNSKK